MLLVLGTRIWSISRSMRSVGTIRLFRLKYLQRSKIFGGSCFRIVLLRESLPPSTVESWLHRDDMEKSNREPPFPSVTFCIWLGTSCGGRIYAPIRCVNPSAPEAVINLVKRGCKKRLYRWCSCKNNIPCTKVCDCVGYSCNKRHNPLEHLEDDMWL